jgi:hypothetical protein
MNYTNRILDFLEAQPEWRYAPDSAGTAEPTALAALALAAYGRASAAARAREWLASAQLADGSVTIRRGEPSPGWPTALALLAWNVTGSTRSTAPQHLGDHAASAADAQAREPYAKNTRRAVAWLLSVAGQTSGPMPYMGHDTALVGWPWVAGTHSWIEPTATSMLALKAVGLADHPRYREAARLLEDRLLPSGGCNYGNTTVLGQTLLPHLEPTGVALLALAGQPDSSGRIRRSLAYLEAELAPTPTSASLAYALLGLAAHGRAPADTDGLLASCAARSFARGSAHELALLALAALGVDCPLASMSAVAQHA